MTERVQVVVRIRPFIDSDPPDAELSTIVLDSTHVTVGSSRVFKVDRVYMLEDETSDIYTESVAPLIDRFLGGCNASILAYGQTGTGKTFTVQSMLPLLLSHLMNSTALQDAAERRAAASASAPPLLKLQYVEVYGESIRDLLAPPSSQLDADKQPKLRLVTTTVAGAASPAQLHAQSAEVWGDARASPQHHAGQKSSSPPREPEAAVLTTGCALVGATVAPVCSIQQAAQLIALGDARRATAATNVHEHSSRSHAILTLFHPRYACRLDVVDLAGSEREKKTGNTGVRFQESIAINTGLLALGNVIRALSRIHRTAAARERTQRQRSPPLLHHHDGGPTPASYSPGAREAGAAAGSAPNTAVLQHVPYRSSKLTRLLQDTLGGSSATLFIACVAPDSANRDETLRTLQYCALALQVLNAPMRQYDRLQRAQSRNRTRHGSSPQQGWREGTDTEGEDDEQAQEDGVDGGQRRQAREDGASSSTADALELRELRAAYTLLQQQYDEQGEVLASICDSYTATRLRLEVCEAELRKDESAFTQQLTVMQRLVQENQKLRHRLTRRATRQRRPQGEERTAQQHREVRVMDTDHQDPDEAHKHGIHPVKKDTDDDDDPALVLQRLLRDYAPQLPKDSRSLSTESGARQATSPVAGVRAARTYGGERVARSGDSPPSRRSPYRHLSFTSGSILRETLSEDGDGPLAPPRHRHPFGAGQERLAADNVWDATPTLPVRQGAASGTASVPVQSFIKSLLRQHGIVTDAEGESGSRQRGEATGSPLAGAFSGVRSGSAVGGAGTPRTPHNVGFSDAKAELQQGNGNSREREGPTLAEPSRPRQEGDQPSTAHHDHDHRIATAAMRDVKERDGQLLQLAGEVLRYEEMNTRLRHQMSVLQAKLDDKAREAARLRLEVQDMKDVYSSLSAMTE